MTDAEYIEILRTHGRRVANRAVLSATPLDARQLSDFYDCYAPDDTLPEAERGRTPLRNSFDPSGWHALYDGKTYAQWPEPESALEPSTALTDPDAATKEAMLQADIAQAGRSVWGAVAHLKTDDEQTRKGSELINEYCARLAAKHGIAADAKLHDAIVDAANECLLAQEQE